MNFEDAFAYVVGEEGNLSMDPNDPGNWTGGAVNRGELKGTKYGVSAAQYPSLDIANLTLIQARGLAKKDYWDQVHGDTLPAATALLMFDECYNAGLEEAVRCAQFALNLTVDGRLGPMTLTALAQTGGIIRNFAPRFTAHRIMAYSQMALWPHDGAGWTMRAVTTLTKALS